MNKARISFYLRTGRVHVDISTLRGLHNPEKICFKLDALGETLRIMPYNKNDFHAYTVPVKVYEGSRSLDISSRYMCNVLARIHHWDVNKSYRALGTIYPDSGEAVFRLIDAEEINRSRI